MEKAINKESKPKIKLRWATTKDNDILGIMRIIRPYVRSIGDIRGGREKLLRETLNREGHFILLAEEAGKIVGFFDLRVYWDWAMPRKSIHVEHMFIEKEYTRKGIGSQMLKVIENTFASEHKGRVSYVLIYTEGGPDISNLMERWGINRKEIYYAKVI